MRVAGSNPAPATNNLYSNTYRDLSRGRAKFAVK